MKQVVLVAIALTMGLLSLTACASAPTPIPTLPPPPTFPPRPTNVPQSPTAPPVSATPVPPTLTPAPTATVAQATASAAQPTSATTAGAPANTVVPATAVPATSVPATATTVPTIESPTPAIPPGLYVTNLRLDPPQPAHNQTIAMGVTLLNSASGDQNVRWVVYVYRAENPTRPNTQSPVNPASFKPGPTVELDSLIRFKLGATGNSCDFFFARVDILDINNQGSPLNGTDGKTFEKGFSICN